MDSAAEFWSPIRLTLELAATTTIVLLVIGTPIAWRLARSRARWKEAVAAFVALPLVLPPTVLGFYLLVALGPNGPGGWIASFGGGRSLAFTFEGLVIGSVIYSMPFVVQPIRNAFEAFGDRPLEVAATLRASPWDAFWSVAVPLARSGFLTGAVLGFAHTVGEFGVVLMIGGNIPGETKVLSVAIYDYVETLRWREVNILAGGMLVFSFAVVLTMMVLEKADLAARPMTDTGAGGDATIEAAFAGALGAFRLDIAFTAPMRGVTGPFGPSGSGKTIALRCMAGLERLAGRLKVGGEVWQDDASGIFRRAHRRPIGYVFQEASLFPHLSVRKNLIYGARRAGNVESGTTLDLDGVVDLLGLSHLLDRSPEALSGGERQRVAVGRALLSRPRLLLMDEPLSALDRMTKEEILPYFEALHRSLQIPVLYVTHDIAELERLADTLVLIERGRVIASGRLSDLQADPTLPLVRAPEAAVTLEGQVVGFDEVYGLTSLSVAGETIVVPGRRGGIGSRQRLRITASDVSFARSRPSDTTILNILPARILSVAPQDSGQSQMNIVAGLGTDGGGPRIVGRVTRKSLETLGLAVGGEIYAQIKSVALLTSGG